MGEVLWAAKTLGMHGAGWAWLALDQSVEESIRFLVDSGRAAGSDLGQGILQAGIRQHVVQSAAVRFTVLARPVQYSQYMFMSYYVA